jgi:MarR family transcriptional regulator, organic hydroperoxide resistance regulator
MKKTRIRKRSQSVPAQKLSPVNHGWPDTVSSPPLSTTLKSFVKNGSDRTLRDLIYSLVAMGNQLARNRKLLASHIGLSEAQGVMLRMIAERRDATVGQLAERLFVTSQFVTIEIGELVKKGLVEKRPNEADRRSMFLRLTAKGEGLIRDLAGIMQMSADIYFRSLTEDRTKLLQETLNTLLIHGDEAYHAMSAPNLRNRR